MGLPWGGGKGAVYTVVRVFFNAGLLFGAKGLRFLFEDLQHLRVVGMFQQHRAHAALP